VQNPLAATAKAMFSDLIYKLNANKTVINRYWENPFVDVRTPEQKRCDQYCYLAYLQTEWPRIS